MSEYPFRNLVFQGGGIKSFAYHGAIRVLAEQGILPQIERVAGSSAGAMMAAVLSFRLSVDESIALYNTLDYSKIPGLKTAVHMPARLILSSFGLAGNVDGLNRLLRHYGWYDTDYAYTWLKETIAAQAGRGDATFADFRARGFRDLTVVATNVSRHRLERFSAATTPDVAVADALLLSQSIPLFFAAPQFDGQALGQGDFFGDGGILTNFPIHLFDGEAYRAGNPCYRYGVNWETLGCRLHTPADCPDAGRRPITNLASYLSNLFETGLDMQIAAYEQRPIEQKRTIDISDCCISATDFRVQPVAGNLVYERLVQAGETAVRLFLSTYQPPEPLPDVRPFSQKVVQSIERFFSFRNRSWGED